MLLTSEVQQHRTDINLVLREIGPILTGVLHERTGSEKSVGINLDQHFFPLEEFSERTPLPEVTQKVATTLRGLSAVVHQLEGTKVALRACKGSVDRLQVNIMILFSTLYHKFHKMTSFKYLGCCS